MKLIVVSMLAVSAAAVAQPTTIRRCIGPGGEPVFTDRPCAQVAPARDAPTTPSPPAAAELTPGAHAAAMRATPQTCPTTSDALRTRVAEAFAARNAVTLSGLVLWDGYASTSALQDLARLVAEPLMGIDVGSAADPERAPGATGDSLVVRTGRDMDRVPREVQTRFAIVPRHGCHWLLPPG
ncbi:hypothetical protein ACQQ2N_14260 [Dokdonella sp. MW10]|uniref:hypothetical protein n=1 Tax=Dokdonella sp. MW10 TaxID=2992926 RepID=UPI003F7F4451